MEHLERGWMNRIAAKIAKKILVLLQDHHVHAGARQQVTEHHARRASAHDAARA